MQFLIPLAILGCLFLVWHTTAKSSIAKGHSTVLSHLGGAVTGLLAAILLFIIAAPKEVPDVATPLSQKMEAPPQATAVPPQQELPAVGTKVERTPPPVQQKVESINRQLPLAEARQVSSLPDAPAIPLALPDEVAEAQPPQQKVMATKEPSLADPDIKKMHAVERLATASQRPVKPVKPPHAFTPPPERRAAVQGPFQLSLTATAKEVWIQVSIDGGPLQRVRLEQGKSVSWTAKRGYKLSLDDAGGVRANLNGKSLPRLGPAGQSRHNIVIPSRRMSTAG